MCIIPPPSDFEYVPKCLFKVYPHAYLVVGQTSIKSQVRESIP